MGTQQQVQHYYNHILDSDGRLTSSLYTLQITDTTTKTLPHWSVLDLVLGPSMDVP